MRQIAARLVLVAALLAAPLFSGTALGADTLPTKFSTLTQQSFTGGKLLSRPGRGGLGDVLSYQRARLRGVIPSARVAFSANPTANDTLTIGTPVIKYVSALGGAITQTQVLIGLSAAATLASTLDAINGVTDANVVAGTVPLSATVVADAVTSTVLRIRLSDVMGGTAVPGVSASLALAASITSGAAAWNVANLSASGKALSDQDITIGSVVITSAMVTAASYPVELPFTPTFVSYDVYVSGVEKQRSDAITISGNAINIALAGGSAPAIQAGDVIIFTAIK